MVDLTACRAVIEKFQSEHPDIVRSIGDPINLQEGWPRVEVWGLYYRPGVYILLNEHAVMYIGEALRPAERLNRHFHYIEATKILETNDPKWRGENKPVFVVIVTIVLDSLPKSQREQGFDG
jgi:hypothetical protein